MSCWPGWAWRRRAIRFVTFIPGSWPPSPGFEPCAILISSSSARFKYRGVTPNRADATCLTRLSRRGPPSSSYMSGSSPPSPELERAPTWFMAIASASCASGESAPSDIAVLTNRLTISLAGSTSSSGTGASESLISITSRTDCVANLALPLQDPRLERLSITDLSFRKLRSGREGEVWVDGGRADCDQARDVVHIDRVAGDAHDVLRHPHAGRQQVFVHRTYSKSHRHRQAVRAGPAVAERYDSIDLSRLDPQAEQRVVQRFAWPICRIEPVPLSEDPRQLGRAEHGGIQLQEG